MDADMNNCKSNLCIILYIKQETLFSNNSKGEKDTEYCFQLNSPQCV